MRTHHRTLLSLLVVAAIATPAVAGELKQYETRYYILHTDLDPDGVREADMRMTRMAEEYYKRTRDFSGAITKQMPFYLFKNAADYHATGAPKGTGGYFSISGSRLVAVAGELGPQTWNTVQHEGFHQFAHSMIRGQLPIWVNEGLAEYFGEGIFTGDGFIIGAIRPNRLKRVRDTMAAGKFKPISTIMEMNNEQWVADLGLANYDQAWSMVQFLAHGQGGRHQRPFGAFIGRLGQGIDWRIAWADTIGDIPNFEQQWKAYWNGLGDNPTLDLFAQANTATLTSYLARAFSQRQRFQDLDSFLQAAKDQQLRYNPGDWLPPSLLKSSLARLVSETAEGCTFTLVIRGATRPRIVCTLPDGRKVTGEFTLRNERVATVTTSMGK